MEELLIRYVHFIGLLVLTSTLVGQHLLIAPSLPQASFKRLAKLDSIYGLAAMIVLITGLTMWFMVGKPKEFYSANGIFHLKVTLFVLIGIISVVPTRFFFKNRNNQQDTISVPKHIISIIRAEMAILVFIPLCAVLMARGIGL